ncbi:hypothetical protein BRE01_23060 [Brevibacillus reuszeri]|uniref:Uncharacterized protein n=1 Tax=Brevibacillus reuszeri TaxID=54915 RepID=A0ABQ0TME1_9BACL|nr:hypothetical protein [Brevibacillus reuszeri]MED1858395.1 hypothetical protein [Brevibacillus reuszeri]GED68604.1 hypothetical protein BRE01_23060 [Brevibacillus reuszeri]
MEFKRLDGGSKMIFIATILAIVSLFFNWIDAGIVALSGFQQQGYLLLILFIYPFMQVIKLKPVNKVIGLVCSILSIISILIFIMSKTVEIFGTTINVASTGMYLYLVASILLLIGVIRHTKKEEIVSAS